MREDDSRKFDTHTDVHTIGLGRNVKIVTDGLHPLTSATSNGNNTFLTVIRLVLGINTVSVFQHFNLLNRCIEEEIHMILHLIVQILKNDIVDVGSQVAYRSIQKFQFILQADFL